MHRNETTLLVCDLDNTLYDWVGFFVPAFYAMVDRAVEITACDREALLDDFKLVHQKHHDSEHPYALLETRLVKTKFEGVPTERVKALLDPAFQAFESVRGEVLRLHHGVRESLDLLTASGVKLVAHTESKVQAVGKRLELLDLVGCFSRIYCRERSVSERLGLRTRENDFWERFPMEKVVELSHHQRKPNVDVLREICRAEKTPASRTAYVGDSVARDVVMAKQAGVVAIWASYGARHDPELYRKLVRVTHWTPEDVAREKELREAAAQVQPDFIATDSFSEVLEAVLPGRTHGAGLNAGGASGA